MSIPVHTILASFTISEQSDEVAVICSPASAADLVVTLPPSKGTTRGHLHRVYVGKASSSAGHAVKPHTGDTIKAHGITPAASKKLICTNATESVGDSATFISDGAGNWFASVTGTWAREA